MFASLCKERIAWFTRGATGPFRLRIATKLVLSFLLIILLTSGVFSIVGVRVIGNRIVAEAQAKVQTDLNAAREIYLNKLASVNDVVRFAADRDVLMNAVLSGNAKQAGTALGRTWEREKLDVLTVTDVKGRVVWRASNPGQVGDDQSGDELVRAVMEHREPVAASCIISREHLRSEAPRLVNQARINFVSTPKASPARDGRNRRHDAQGCGSDS